MSDNDFPGSRRRRRGGAAFSPSSLFANGEQGVWYDPSDLTPEKVSWRRNLLTYSQDFDNAAWTKSNASILSNLALYSQDFDNAAWVNQVAGTGVAPTRTANFATAPDGTMTADRLQFSLGGGTTTADFSYIAQAIIPLSIVHTGSFYVKLNSGTADIYVRTGNGSATYTVTSSWTRVEVACTAANTSSQFAIGLRGGQTPANTNTADILVWGAQLVPGSTAQTYTRSLATAAPIQFADPLGGTLADKLIENTATAFHQMAQSIATTTGITQTLTLYAKAAERTQVAMQLGADAAFFNLSNGTIVSGTGATITDAGNGWYRCALTKIPTSTNVLVFTASGGSANYAGDGVSGVFVYGAQLESASTASAYQRITNFNGDFSAAFPNHALYQESVGPSPVTALGQSVGLVLDKRLGPPGPELVANGTFADGTGWAFSTGWELGNGVAAGISASGNLRYAFTSINGATYRVQFDWTHGGGTLNVRVGGGTSTTFTTSGTHATYVVGGASTTFGVDFFGGAATGFLDNVSVRLVSGNHALQATSASRPTLQARSNLLTYSEQFDNAAWTKSAGVSVTANATVAPDGAVTADLLNDDGLAATNSAFMSVTFTGDGEKCVALYLRAGTAAQSGVSIFDTTAATHRHRVNITWTAGVPTIATQSGSGTLYPVEALANGWYRVLFSATGVVAANTNRLYVYPTGFATAVSGTLYAWGAQVENATVPTTYQRVTTATDYADVGLPRNLLFDGVDDSLATSGNVDFTATDKVSLFSGLFKASDAAIGMVTELSASVSLNNGTFYLSAPNSAAGANYAFVSKGTSSASQTTSATAPDTAVVTGLGDIGAPSAIIRRNGVQSSNATTQGTGNYGTYPLYVGRRGGSTLPFNGRLFQLVIRGAATDSVTIQNTERFVAGLTGVTL